jgi:hypothetical protein
MRYKQYVEQHKNFGRVRTVPRLCGLYPGIFLTAEEKAQKNLSQGSSSSSSSSSTSTTVHLLKAFVVFSEEIFAVHEKCNYALNKQWQALI